ncbi:MULTISPECIES: LamG-like jellyroll fold domain-containing protein [Pirellulaceae]|nr:MULTISPECIES: LamG-like jellyroll fold domain-containing protein [Pirellulaceae]
MSQQTTPQLEREARLAIDRLVDGQISPEEFARLEQRLLTDQSFRLAYVEQSDMQSELEHHLRSFPPLTINTDHAESSSWGLPFAIALSVLILLGFANLFFINSWKSAFFGEPMLDFAESQLIGQGPVAMVIRRSEEASAGSPLQIGDRLKPGALRLNRGDLQLEFLSGVRVQLTGPAEMHLLTEHQATLLSGQAGVVTPPDSDSFSLNGPVSAVVNGSSEFVLHVEGPGRGEVDVFQGEVMTSLLGPSGDTLLNEMVTSNHRALFADGELTVSSKTFDQSQRIDTIPVDNLYLNPTDQYAEAVKADAPLVYWRFEDGDVIGNQIVNHMGDHHHGEIHSAEDGSIEISRGRIRFAKSPQGRHVGLSEPIEGINRRAFSIEFWVRTDRMHWGTFLGLLPVTQADPEKESHLCVLEYANQTNVVHRPATIRMLYRYPPTTYDGGKNIFSPNSCTPGIWTHIVAVKTPEAIRLYCDGQLQVNLDDLDFDDSSPYTVVLGQLDSVRSMRQLEGQLDEVAIYEKALTEEQIRRHYEIIAGPPKT